MQNNEHRWEAVNLSVRIVNLVFHTTYVVCVNFMREWQYLQFKVDPKRQMR